MVWLGLEHGSSSMVGADESTELWRCPRMFLSKNGDRKLQTVIPHSAKMFYFYFVLSVRLSVRL